MAEKPTLLLLPGLLCDGTVWAHQVQDLADIAAPRVVTYRDATAIGEMAAEVLRRAPGRFALAGHSMGGRVALEVYRQAGDRVSHLALLDTATGPVRPEEHDKRMGWVTRARAEGTAVLVKDWLPPMLHPDHLTDGYLMATLANMIEGFTADQFAGQIQALLTRPDATPVLGTITCPTLVLCGRQDSWSVPDKHEEMARMIPNARLEIVEDCGHMAPIEQPDRVTSHLRRWLLAAGSGPANLETSHTPRNKSPKR